MNKPLVPTPSQTVGPFFHFCLTAPQNCVRSIAGPQTQGERVLLECHVFDGAGEPVPDAMIEIWQADAAGRYRSVGDTADHDNRADPDWRGFGRMATDATGRCDFVTIRPGRVPGPAEILQSPHLEVAIFARGMLKQLYTRIYFGGDPANAQDPVLQLVPEDRRETLMARPDPAQRGHWQFQARLQGDRETVFFDV